MIPGFKSATRQSPCPICGKPDWCMVAKDGSIAACHRVTSGTPFGKAGFVHRLQEKIEYRRYINHQVHKNVEIDADAIHHAYSRAITRHQISAFASHLGVSERSLVDLGIGRAVEWCEGTYSFPMRDGAGKIIGIRLRNFDGNKWAVYGSKNGLFYKPGSLTSDIFVCEGPTSAAALITMKFSTIGRPSNLSGTQMLVDLISSLGDVHAVVMSEMDGKPECQFCNDNFCQHCKPGEYGASVVSSKISGYAKSVRVLNPAVGKDVRDWLKSGANRQVIMEHLK